MTSKMAAICKCDVICRRSIPKNWNNWCFRPRYCTCKAVLDRGQPGLMGWILLWILSLMQDRSLGLLTSSPARYHCTTDAPWRYSQDYFKYQIHAWNNTSLHRWSTSLLFTHINVGNTSSVNVGRIDVQVHQGGKSAGMKIHMFSVHM